MRPSALTYCGIIAAVLFSHEAVPDALNVAVCGAAHDHYVLDVQTNLAATARFSAVDALDVRFGTPALTTLQEYAALVVFSDSSYADATNLGTTLADYVDGGGGVVPMVFECASYSFFSPPRFLYGRWETGGYVAIPRGDPLAGPMLTLGAVHEPAHPIMAGVTNLNGGVRSYRPSTTNINDGWTRIADWSDGAPLVAARDINGGRVAALAFFPVSDNISTVYWHTATDGATLMANALEWAAAPEPCMALPPAGSAALAWLARRGRRSLRRRKTTRLQT
ncbi:PEP-CTERM sorting domain-containing protein [bacterium]|nr:PEP-CTERM sorting domain-containing protein [bacterium]